MREGKHMLYVSKYVFNNYSKYKRCGRVILVEHSLLGSAEEIAKEKGISGATHIFSNIREIERIRKEIEVHKGSDVNINISNNNIGNFQTPLILEDTLVTINEVPGRLVSCITLSAADHKGLRDTSKTLELPYNYRKVHSGTSPPFVYQLLGVI
ncbi:MAG: hypothetical protein ABIH72_02995 [archaeon]